MHNYSCPQMEEVMRKSMEPCCGHRTCPTSAELGPARVSGVEVELESRRNSVELESNLSRHCRIRSNSYRTSVELESTQRAENANYL